MKKTFRLKLRQFYNSWAYHQFFFTSFLDFAKDLNFLFFSLFIDYIKKYALLNAYCSFSTTFGEDNDRLYKNLFFVINIFSFFLVSNKLMNVLPLHICMVRIIILSLFSFVNSSTLPFLTNQIDCVCVDCIRAKNDYYIDFEIRKIWALVGKKIM